MCDRVVDEVLEIASFGELAPSDILFDSSCVASGCTATLLLFAPNGFGIEAKLRRSGPGAPWRIESVVRDPGGPMTLPSPSA